jgi:DNA-binding LytR/AlgR family response regulator
MNGRELVDEALRRRPGLKILFTTGYAGSVMLADQANGQRPHVLMKPYSIEDLALRLKALLHSADQDHARKIGLD